MVILFPSADYGIFEDLVTWLDEHFRRLTSRLFGIFSPKNDLRNVLRSFFYLTAFTPRGF
jgi:hypothetical protein